jgi:hypothetical protein
VQTDNLVKVSDEKGNQVQLEKLDSVVSANDSSLQAIMPGIADSIKSGLAKKKKNGKGNFRLSSSDYKSVAQYDSIQQSLPAEKRDGWIKRKFAIRGIELNEKYKDNLSGFGKDFGKAFMENFSKILFFLLPVFALILKLLYVRRDFYYSEHLVFSIYYYNFVYLAGSLYMLVNLVPALGWMATLIAIWIYVYLLVGMKRMYGQSWRKTIFKYVIFLGAFILCAAVGMTVNAVFILLLI